MSEPIIEQILASLASQLATITAANGFAVTVSAVKRPICWESFSPEDMQIVLGLADRDEVEEPAEDQTEYLQNIELYAVIKPSETSTDAADTLLSRFVASVEKCLVSDETWMIAGLVDYKFGSFSRIPPNVTCDGAVCPIVLHYRHARGNPFGETPIHCTHVEQTDGTLFVFTFDAAVATNGVTGADANLAIYDSARELWVPLAYSAEVEGDPNSVTLAAGASVATAAQWRIVGKPGILAGSGTIWPGTGEVARAGG